MLLSWVYFTYICSAALASPELWLRRSAILDKEGRFHVAWGTGDRNDIIFKLEVRTLGYVALGFSRDATMVNSDFVIGWVVDGQAYLQDRYAESNRMPELDHRQDWELLSGAENATHTTLVFRRKWDTCDPQDLAFEYDNTVRVIHAYSYEDPTDEINIPVHSLGFRSFLLLQPEIPKETDVQYWDMTTNDFTVSPEWETFYLCKLFKTPDFGKKQHVTTMEPLILGGNRGDYVHHILVFECKHPNATQYDQFMDPDGYDCNTPSPPAFTKECDGYYTIWTRGGEGIVLPQNLGFPLEPNKYMMLEVHYDNANRDIGTPGRAGIRYHHTPHLRQYDAGMIGTGADVFWNVMAPPGVRDYMVSGHLNPDCTGPAMNPEGVTLHSATLHTHHLGRRMKLRHFRDKMELLPLAHNKYYDPDYQQHSIFAEERLLMPGDQLTLECTYDSTSRTRATLGGNSTREEMCAAFIVYYPRFEGAYGSRTIPPASLYTHLIGSEKLKRLTASQPNEFSQTFADFMTDYNWNKTAIRWFENKLRYAEQITYCYLGTGDLESVPSTVSYPKGLQEYIEPPSCSSQIDKARG